MTGQFAPEGVGAPVPGGQRVVYQGDTTLPPPGYQRDEVLARRADDLAERADQMNAGVEAYSFPSTLLDPTNLDNEIAGHVDELSVIDAQPGFAYKWVKRDVVGGKAVIMAQREGWQVVCGDMPENRANMNELSQRQIGDVILMRIQKDRYHLLQRAAREAVARRSEAVDAGFAELGEQVRGRGIIAHTKLEGPLLKGAMTLAQEEQVKRLARQQFEQMVREGAIPHLHPGRPV